MKNIKYLLLCSIICFTTLSIVFVIKPLPLINKTIKSDEKQEIKGAVEWLQKRRNNQITGLVDIKDVLEAQKQIALLKNQNRKSSSNLVWNELGPDNIGGRTRAIIIDKDNPNLMFACGVAGGIWKSVSAGTSWEKVNDHFENLAFVSICQAKNGDYYFGTGEGMYGNWGTGSGGIEGQGIWKSTDRGNTFTRLSSTWSDAISMQTFVNVNKLAADPNNENRIYAATKKGLRVTDDGGNTWFDPIHSSAVSSDVKVASNGTVIASVNNRGYISPSGDDNTFDICSGNTTNLISSNANRLEFAFAPSDPNYIYCQAAIYGTTIVYRSINKGVTWSKILDGTAYGSFNPLGDQGTYDNCIAVFPNNKDKVIIGGQISLYIGLNYNDFFQWDEITSSQYFGRTNPLYVHADHHAIVFHPTNPNIIFIGSDGGISRSIDGGKTYKVVNNGYKVTQFYSVGFSGHNEVVGGSQDNGTLYIDPDLHLSPGTGMGADIVDGGDGGYSELSLLDPTIGFSTVYYGVLGRFNIGSRAEQVFKSNTGGSFVTPICLWESFNDTLSTDFVVFNATEDYNAGDTIISTSKTGQRKLKYILKNNLSKGDSISIQDIYQSVLAIGVNGGVKIARNALFSVPTFYSIGSGFGTVTTMAFSKDGNYLFFATGGGLYRVSNILSARDKASIENLATKFIGNFNQTITSIAVDPVAPNNVIITLGNYGNSKYVYYSNNAVTTTSSNGNFFSKQGNLPKMPVYSSIIQWNNSKQVIIGTEYGIYSTDDITVSSPVWYDENQNGFPLAPVFMLRQQIHENNWNNNISNHGYIYAATHGRGIFKSETLKGPLAIPNTNNNINTTYFNIFPNPANDYISLTFNSDENVKVYIYNIKGDLVFNKKTNNVKEIINVSSLNKGIYIMKVISDKGSNSKKFIKL